MSKLYTNDMDSMNQNVTTNSPPSPYLLCAEINNHISETTRDMGKINFKTFIAIDIAENDIPYEWIV